jgi:integrase
MPKLSSFRITKRFVDALVTDRDAIYFDADLRGFAVRTKPTGSKTYLVQYQSNGRTRRVSIGPHGVLTPAEARQRAAALLAKARAGEDPAEERAIARRAMTVRQLCDSYLDAAEKGLVLGKYGLAKKASTLATDRGRIIRHIIPLLGSRKVRDLTTPDIIRFMRDVTSGKTAVDIRTKARGRAIVEGGKGTAARTVGLLGGILSFAVSEGVMPSNPARGVRRPADGRRRVRLSGSQYAALGRALEIAEGGPESRHTLTAIRLLALTGCRRGEIERLRWSEVDRKDRCLRLGDSKTGASVRPLGSAALRLLDSLPRGESEFVFPSSRGDGYFSGLPKVWQRILKLVPPNVGLQALTPHGLRHAFASAAHELGFTEITIAALLGHATATVTGRYIHHVDTVLLSAADATSERIAAAMSNGAVLVSPRKAA